MFLISTLEEGYMALHCWQHQQVAPRSWCRCYWIPGPMSRLKEDGMSMHCRQHVRVVTRGWCRCCWMPGSMSKPSQSASSIASAFRATGLVPYDPDQVLASTTMFIIIWPNLHSYLRIPHCLLVLLVLFSSHEHHRLNLLNSHHLTGGNTIAAQANPT